MIAGFLNHQQKDSTLRSPDLQFHRPLSLDMPTWTGFMATKCVSISVKNTGLVFDDRESSTRLGSWFLLAVGKWDVRLSELIWSSQLSMLQEFDQKAQGICWKYWLCSDFHELMILKMEMKGIPGAYTVDSLFSKRTQHAFHLMSMRQQTWLWDLRLRAQKRG